ncbi:hypothetical protein [Streptomyces ossamyceticus]|uniref:hypothetical protein n=1 Tax=Streptomyces ossamyceticus TaxID=249581 RepID=UPI0006E19B7C|nr:hypothetical protein [Streptomyces ossamyceticus]
MTARRAWTAAYWPTVLALALALAETTPFTGPYATASDFVIAAGVGLIGLATTPHQKGRTQ